MASPAERGPSGTGHDTALRCVCGSLLFVCKKCGDDRCMVCDPYDDSDNCSHAAEPRVTEAAPVPADPVVSPADTLRRYVLNSVPMQTKRGVFPAADAYEALAALLAVGERDRAEIEALTAAVEGLLDVEERSRGGDQSLGPEEWFAIRDYARKVLKDGR